MSENSGLILPEKTLQPKTCHFPAGAVIVTAVDPLTGARVNQPAPVFVPCRKEQCEAWDEIAENDDGPVMGCLILAGHAAVISLWHRLGQDQDD